MTNNKRRNFRAIIAVLLVALMVSGCTVLPRTSPPSSFVGGLREISIVPVEPPPLLLEPGSKENWAALTGTGYLLSNKHDGSVFIVSPMYWPYCVKPDPAGAEPRTLANPTATSSLEFATFVSGGVPTCMLTSVLARKAAEKLQQNGNQRAVVVDGYVQLDIEHRSLNVPSGLQLMQNWYPPLRLWYSAEDLLVDYPPMMAESDAILEVGISNFRHFAGYLMLQVMLKLMDPETEQVVGRANCMNFLTEVGPLAKMLDRQGEPLRQAVNTVGEKLLDECLRDLGLIP